VPPDSTHSQDVVTAVIVAHDGAAWIPHVAHAVASQSRPVQRVVAVDTGSRDRSGAMLAQAFGRGCVFGMDRATGFAAAVGQALRHRAAHAHVPPPPGGPREDRAEWLWLLHDDCEPAPDALERLLAGAGRAPAAAVLGPKVLDWSDRDVLLEAGITIDRAGRRVTGIEPREVDQGQHDGDRDVLAVSSAGMLVRRDVFEQLGGFDPGMRLFREDTDLCWRVQAAGYRVRVVTDAVVYHVEASARNRRATSAAPRRRREDRRNGLLVLLGNLPARPMLSALAGSLVLSALRTLFFLIAKRPGAALDEFSACTSVACHPLRLATARRLRARGRQAAYGRLRGELPPGRSLRRLAEFATGALSRTLPVDTVGSHHATDDPSDDDSLLVDTGLVQRLLTSPVVLLFLTLTVIALVAERSLLGGTPLGGGALVPAWGGVSGLWREYLQGFHPAGIGTAASTPPYVAVIALLATLLGGKPWLAVDVLLLGCVPLAGVTAFLATRRVTRYLPARLWAAAAYALLPTGMGAVAAGRLGTAVVLVLLPLVALLAGRIFTQPPRRARRAAWATALAAAVAAAFVPLVWLVTVVAMAAALLAFGRGRAGAALNALIVAAVPLVLLLPWSVGLLSHPALLFSEAGVPVAGLADPRLPARALLLLSPGGPGLPPYWITGGVAAAAAVALIASRRRAVVLAGWGVALVGTLTAAGVSRVALTTENAAGPVHAWPGAALAIAGVGLLLAALAGGEGAGARLRAGGWHGPRGLAVLLVAVVACSAPALAAAAWLTSGVRGPVAPAAAPLLPEFVAVSSDTGLRPRTLVLRAAPGGGVSYAVLRDSDPLIGSGELTMPPPAAHALNLGVAALVTPHGGDVADQGRALAGLGIGYVMLPAPVDTGLARILDGVPGLRPVSDTSAFQLWRVIGTAARVTVTEPDGTVVAVPSGTTGVSGASAPSAGGTLVLAEPAGGWTATLNGHPLTPVAAGAGGWAQGFRLPAGGGSLSVSRDQTGRYAAVGLEALAVLVVAGLGLPGAKVAGEAEEAASGRARGPGRRSPGLRAAVPGMRGGTRRRARPAAGPDGQPPEPDGAAPAPARARRGAGSRVSRRGAARPAAAEGLPPRGQPLPRQSPRGAPARGVPAQGLPPRGDPLAAASSSSGRHGYHGDPAAQSGAAGAGPGPGTGRGRAPDGPEWPAPRHGSPAGPGRPEPYGAPAGPGWSPPRDAPGDPGRSGRHGAPTDPGRSLPHGGPPGPDWSPPPGDPGRSRPRGVPAGPGRSLPRGMPEGAGRSFRRGAPQDPGRSVPPADPGRPLPRGGPGDPTRSLPRQGGGQPAPGDPGRSRSGDYRGRPGYGPAPSRGRPEPEPGQDRPGYGEDRPVSPAPRWRRGGRGEGRRDDTRHEDTRHEDTRREDAGRGGARRGGRSYGLVPRGRQPSEEGSQVLPPLPPMPPRRHRYGDEYQDGAWDGQAYDDPGESDW
jgi:GT2 family glycosyltransferase